MKSIVSTETWNHSLLNLVLLLLMSVKISDCVHCNLMYMFKILLVNTGCNPLCLVCLHDLW